MCFLKGLDFLCAALGWFIVLCPRNKNGLFLFGDVVGLCTYGMVPFSATILKHGPSSPVEGFSSDCFGMWMCFLKGLDFLCAALGWFIDLCSRNTNRLFLFGDCCRTGHLWSGAFFCNKPKTRGLLCQTKLGIYKATSQLAFLCNCCYFKPDPNCYSSRYLQIPDFSEDPDQTRPDQTRPDFTKLN